MESSPAKIKPAPQITIYIFISQEDVNKTSRFRNYNNSST